MMRAWDLNKPTLLCPAMNTHMWTHPLTAQHLKFCQETLNFFVIPPVSKVLMCGDFGEFWKSNSHISNFRRHWRDGQR